MAETRDLLGRRFILGVCGGIAAYKTAEVVRAFKRRGALVQVLMTEDAARFVTPLTMGTLSEREVLTHIFPENMEGSWTRHVHLGLWADAMVVAPATANTIAKLAAGSCDSMLTAVALSARCPLLVCPAMDHDMYEHASTRDNLDTLRQRGATVMDVSFGELASGLTGSGRLPEPADIVSRAIELIRQTDGTGPLAGKHVVVTAGPTRERLDPVRYLSNRSTGTMGFALAEAARRRGAHVTLVAGPSALAAPDGVQRVDVESADEMYDAVHSHADADLIVMAAAVADYAPATLSPSKIKKSDGDLVIHLRRTRDILGDLGQKKPDGQILVGFALETHDAEAGARSKLARKNLDWIVLNNPLQDGAGFGTGTNRVTVFGRDDSVLELPVLAKSDVAEAILNRVLGLA